LPQELKEVLDPDTRAIIEIEYKHARAIGEIKSPYDADRPVYYFRLPGGIDLFMRGYTHDPEWKKKT
jgi:hypothetical protein